MKFYIKIDSEEDLPNPFLSDTLGKLESVIEEEAPLLCRQLEDYAEVEVSVSFLDSAEMRGVNKRHRGLDEPTDVLTFPLWEEEGRLVLPDCTQRQFELLPLGDIVICVEETMREHAPMACAEALCLVLAHGFLHLLGWDHDTPEKEDTMWNRQELLKTKLLNAAQRGILT